MEHFHRIHYIGNSRRESKDDDLNQSVNQSNSKGGSSSCQCTMTSIGDKEETETIVLANALRVTEYARRFPQGRSVRF